MKKLLIVGYVLFLAVAMFVFPGEGLPGSGFSSGYSIEISNTSPLSWIATPPDAFTHALAFPVNTALLLAVNFTCPLASVA